MMREARAWPGVADVTAGLQNLTLFLDETKAAEDIERRLVGSWQRSETHVEPSSGTRVEIPVIYGGECGPDLCEVARACGLSEREVIERHCAGDYVVSFLGFVPGFAYLDGLDTRLHVPRRATPRTRVPAGSVGIGGEQTGAYPFALPGGWNLIGRTGAILFDPHRSPAALLAPGDRVRFVERA